MIRGENTDVTIRMAAHAPLNKANEPDEFEDAALKQFADGKREYSEIQNTADGRRLLRYAVPIFAAEPCVACHPHLKGQSGQPFALTSVAVDISDQYRSLKNGRFAFYGIIALIILGASIAIYLVIGRVLSSLRDAQQQLVDIASTDELTGLANRRSLFTRLDLELARARREGYPVALAMLDLDSFKSINDELGHAVGDEVLKLTGGALRKTARPYDITSRLGGEEFVVVMPGVHHEAAHAAVERVRESIAESTSQGWDQLGRVTASAGIAVFDPSRPESADSLLMRADDALLVAKRSGKDHSKMAKPNS